MKPKIRMPFKDYFKGVPQRFVPAPFPARSNRPLPPKNMTFSQ